MPATQRVSSSACFLTLSAKDAGLLHSFEGGYPVGDVAISKSGPRNVQLKHIAQVHYEPMTMSFGAGMSEDFYRFIEGTVNNEKVLRVDGSIVQADLQQNQTQQLNFLDACLVELGIPAADASSKAPLLLQVQLQPEVIRTAKGSGKVTVGKSSKPSLLSNFRLTIAGIDCTRVSRVEALTVKFPVTMDNIDMHGSKVAEPAGREIPDLVVTFPEGRGADFYDWLDQFVVQGHSNAENEKSGTLEFLTPDLKSVVCSIDFSGLGIYKIVPEPVVVASEVLRRATASMYCQRMQVKFKS